jgi:hypothetical protein
MAWPRSLKEEENSLDSALQTSHQSFIAPSPHQYTQELVRAQTSLSRRSSLRQNYGNPAKGASNRRVSVAVSSLTSKIFLTSSLYIYTFTLAFWHDRELESNFGIVYPLSQEKSQVQRRSW